MSQSRSRRSPAARCGTLAISWGPYGGFYLCRHRVCLGWLAITSVPGVEIEDLMRAHVEIHGVLEALDDELALGGKVPVHPDELRRALGSTR